MNFKLNAWTLLFAISAAFMLWNACEQTATAVETTKTTINMDDRLWVNPNNCPESDPMQYTISDSLFMQDTLRYGQYLRGELTPVNEKVIYFALEPCEVLNMARTMTWDQKVRAYMAINSDNQIVVHFRGEEYVPSDAKAKAASGGMVNYDFTAPCPDLCPGS